MKHQTHFWSTHLANVRDGDWATTQPANHHHPSSANHAKEQQSIELARGPTSEFGVKSGVLRAMMFFY